MRIDAIEIERQLDLTGGQRGLAVQARRPLLHVVSDVIRKRQDAGAKRRLRVELTTAIELSDAEASRIVKQIEDASGRKVEATRRVDPGLIGGLVLQAGSMRLDSSVRGRLERLRQELATARR